MRIVLTDFLLAIIGIIVAIFLFSESNKIEFLLGKIISIFLMIFTFWFLFLGGY